jgi:hypothetical protein
MFRPSNGRIQTVNDCSKLKLVFLFLHFLQIDILYSKTLVLSWTEKSSKENLSRLIPVLSTYFRQCVRHGCELNTSAGTVTRQRDGRQRIHCPIPDKCTNNFLLISTNPDSGVPPFSQPVGAGAVVPGVKRPVCEADNLRLVQG